MSKKNDDPKSGIYRDYGQQLAEVQEFYDRKKSECPKGVTLHHPNGTKYINLQFVDPLTKKRNPKSCGINTFTEESVIEAIQKAHKVSAALKTISPNEFWSWYDREILNKSEKLELLTYRQIFEDVESEYYSGVHKNTDEKRTKDVSSFENSFDRTYGVVFRKFPDWDKVPTWDEMLSVWHSWKQGTKSFKDAKTAITAICKRLPNADELLKRAGKVRSKQTIFKKRQSIDLDTYLIWYESAWESMLAMRHPIHREGRANWLWASAMNVIYGLRPSETAAILNLDKPFTIDGATLYPLTDTERNPKGIVVVGEYTSFGTTTKTGMRPIAPVPDKELMEKLRIRDARKLDYTPQPGSSPKVICEGFSKQFRKSITSAKCPVSQLYAFRHLYNYLCELHGVPLEQRSADMGHDPQTNQRKYKSRRDFKDKLELAQRRKPQPLPYDVAITKLHGLGIDTHSPDINLTLRTVYQVD